MSCTASPCRNRASRSASRFGSRMSATKAKSAPRHSIARSRPMGPPQRRRCRTSRKRHKPPPKPTNRMSAKEHSKESRDRSRTEIAIVGELDDCEADVIGRLLELDDGSECTLYIDSGGGRVYSAMAIMSLMLLKGLRARAIVLGACSSATLLILAGCRTRLAMPYSVFQFHPVRWESGENVEPVGPSEWARHFG